MSAPFNFIYVGIDELTSIGYKIYPNPVNSILTFEQSSSGKIVYSICDATGRIVIDKNASVARKISIDVSMLSPGIYIFCVEGNINKRMLFVKE
jgi:hypothetical protein